ncbi:MAG TPA: hypothetical protein PK748_10945, partial [Acidimicrobiales bacterium]|nr:hypothetical protein [Acidimicrobiales bacterium]
MAEPSAPEPAEPADADQRPAALERPARRPAVATGGGSTAERRFEVVSPFGPAGDQPKAIEQLVEGVEGGERFQTLLGITGSGKSATIAWTIEKLQRPVLVLAPNKS